MRAGYVSIMSQDLQCLAYDEMHKEDDLSQRSLLVVDYAPNSGKCT